MTGARFRVVNGRLRFEIRATQFDYETGKLNLEYSRSRWQGNEHYTAKEKINIENADVPTLSPEKSRRYRGDNKYIEFTPTDIHMDAAQTTGISVLGMLFELFKFCISLLYVTSNVLYFLQLLGIFSVPFIDTQPVEARAPKPLRGAGIYYKTTPGYGGFIGPLIIIHDFD